MVPESLKCSAQSDRLALTPAGESAAASPEFPAFAPFDLEAMRADRESDHRRQVEMITSIVDRYSSAMVVAKRPTREGIAAELFVDDVQRIGLDDAMLKDAAGRAVAAADALFAALKS